MCSNRFEPRIRFLVGSVICWIGGWSAAAAAADAVITVKSGMQFRGKFSRIISLVDNPLAPQAAAAGKPIVIIDDELRYTFVGYPSVANTADGPPGTPERIKIDQRVAQTGRPVVSVGYPIEVTPFDEYGRRTYSMVGARSRVDVIQGITEITPTYIKVEGLLVSNPYVWDLRINMNSQSRETLSRILMRQLDPRDADARLRIVRLYIQAERYRDALVELERAMRDLPDLKDLSEQADRLLQLLADQILREIELRRRAGQHEQVHALLSGFPEAGVAGETLIRVRDMLSEYARQKEQRDRALQLLEAHLAELKDAKQREALQPIAEEMRRELSIHTLNRMADYLRLADDDSLAVDQKLALAITGWLLGSGSGGENLAVAQSLVEVRNAVVEYLRSDRPHERSSLLERIQGLEGGTPASVAQILEHIKPPLDFPQTEPKIPGLYELSVPGIEEQSEFQYLVQLPPEYHPHRRYPCVVTLNGRGKSEFQQIAWWAGDYNEKTGLRDGQASRRGYIVLAPRWQKPHQLEYEFSAREHAAVLYSLRDACRRFSIDTNRVFLHGYSMGGDAAWDMGLSHPDLWAGLIAVSANRAKYIRKYKDNARGLPMYFVGGYLDGNWLRNNGSDFDDYLRFANFDCTVVAYRGRGHEDYADEIQRICEWMELESRTRNFFPKEVSGLSMRPWDNFFWWLEVHDMPRRSLVYPSEWPSDKDAVDARPIETKGQVLENNRISVTPRSERVTIWLSPKMVSFDRPIGVSVRARELRADTNPRVEVILEDVRTRGDRQNPFWAKVEWPDRRG